MQVLLWHQTCAFIEGSDKRRALDLEIQSRVLKFFVDFELKPLFKNVGIDPITSPCCISAPPLELIPLQRTVGEGKWQEAAPLGGTLFCSISSFLELT